MKLPECLNIHLKISLKIWLISSPSVRSCQDSAYFHFLVKCHKAPENTILWSHHTNHKTHSCSTKTDISCAYVSMPSAMETVWAITLLYYYTKEAIVQTPCVENVHSTIFHQYSSLVCIYYKLIYTWTKPFTINELNHLSLASKPIFWWGCPKELSKPEELPNPASASLHSSFSLPYILNHRSLIRLPLLTMLTLGSFKSRLQNWTSLPTNSPLSWRNGSPPEKFIFSIPRKGPEKDAMNLSLPVDRSFHSLSVPDRSSMKRGTPRDNFFHAIWACRSSPCRTHLLPWASPALSWPPPGAARRRSWPCGSRSRTCSCTAGWSGNWRWWVSETRRRHRPPPVGVPPGRRGWGPRPAASRVGAGRGAGRGAERGAPGSSTARTAARAAPPAPPGLPPGASGIACLAAWLGSAPLSAAFHLDPPGLGSARLDSTRPGLLWLGSARKLQRSARRSALKKRRPRPLPPHPAVLRRGEAIGFVFLSRERETWPGIDVFVLSLCYTHISPSVFCPRPVSLLLSVIMKSGECPGWWLVWAHLASKYPL